MKKAKRLVAIALAISAIMSLFTGCSGNGKTASNSSAGSAAQQSEETVNLKICFASGVERWLQPILDQYNSSQSKYKVTTVVVSSGSDMYTKLTMMMQSPKTCPDVIYEDGFMINSDVAAGRLMPLDDELKDWSDLQQFNPTVLEGSKGQDGKLYAIPISTDTQGIYYNKKLLQKIGVSLPWQPHNWNDIIDVAKKLKAENASNADFIPMFIYASKTYTEETSMRTFQALLSGTEGSYPEQIYDKTSGKWVVDSDKLLKVFNFVNQVYNVDKIGPTPSFSAQPKVDSVIVSDYMKNDKIGMYFTGSWTMGSYGEKGQYPWKEAMDHYAFANIPTCDGSDPQYTTMSGGWTWAIPANANHKEGAVELLKVLGSKDSQMSELMATGDITARKDIAKDEKYLSQSPSSVKEATAQLEFTHFRPSVNGYSSLTTMFASVIESIAIGTATPEKALENFKTEMTRIAGQNKVIVK